MVVAPNEMKMAYLTPLQLLLLKFSKNKMKKLFRLHIKKDLLLTKYLSDMNSIFIELRKSM